MIVPTLLLVLTALLCGALSLRCAVHKEWTSALILALPLVYVVSGVSVESLRRRAIEDARMKAIERGDIPAEESHRQVHEDAVRGI